MKRKIISTLMAGSMLLSFVACQKLTPPEPMDETKGTTVNETIKITDPNVSIDTPVETTVPVITVSVQNSDVSSDAIISFEPLETQTRLFPIYSYVKLLEYDAYVYTYDPGYYDNVAYKMGLVDANGNIVCDADLSYVDYMKENDTYVVVKLGEFGITSCGLISADGTKCTGFDYNGYYVAPDGTSYLSKYSNGVMTITCYDKDLNIVFENKEIKVDSNTASALYSSRGICVRASYEDTTVIGSMDILHSINNCLINNESGEVICNVDRIFGEYLIDNIGELFIRDKNGDVVYTQYKRYIYFEGESLVLYNDNEMISIDINGIIGNKIDLEEGFFAVETDNFVCLNNNDETNIYDKYLNLKVKCSDFASLNSGFVFEIVKGDETSIVLASVEGGYFKNIVSGNMFKADIMSCIFYTKSSLGLLYIDTSNCEVKDTEGFVGYYDKDLNLVDISYSSGHTVVDIITGECYTAVYDSETNVTTVYNSTSNEKYCELNDYLNDYFIVCDGILCGVIGNNGTYGSTRLYQSVLVDKDGKFIKTFDVENG